jgi:hypothetical protein
MDIPVEVEMELPISLQGKVLLTSCWTGANRGGVEAEREAGDQGLVILISTGLCGEVLPALRGWLGN